MLIFHSTRRILAFAAVCSLTALPSVAPAEEPLASASGIAPVIDPIGPIGPAPVRPPVGSVAGPFLVGHFSDLTIKPTKTGNFVNVKGSFSIENTGLEVARNVRVAVYLSPDRTRTPGEKPIGKVKLASFDHGDGKVKAGDSAKIPLKYKLPKLIASSLSGKYLIFVLAANNFPAKEGAPVVEGPLPMIP